MAYEKDISKVVDVANLKLLKQNVYKFIVERDIDNPV